MQKLKIKNLIFLFFILFFLFNAGFAFAQEINYPNLPGVEEPQDFLGTADEGDLLGLWLKYIIHLLIWVSGVTAFLFLVIGGLTYLTSSGSPDRLKDARSRIINSFLGLTIVLSSYIILGVLSPYFLNFNLPGLQDIEPIPDYPEEPEKKENISSIDVYIPVGRLIETIFETYISRVPTEEDPIEEGELTRIQRITNILDATTPILPEILVRTEEIRDLSKKCSCRRYTDPDPRCNSSGCGSCFPKFCTGDPCESVRGDIVHAEQDLLPFFFGEVVTATQHDAYGREFTIQTNLTKEIDRLEEEIRLLKELFGKLGRTQEMINSCDLLTLHNLNQFFQKKDHFEGEEWFIDPINFFDDIDIIYNRPVNPRNIQERWYPVPGTPMEQFIDESALYCSVGGTYNSQPIDFEDDPIWIQKRWENLRFESLGETPEISSEEFEDLFTFEEVEDMFSYELSCDIMIPFGEVLDKAHRTTRLLINRLELIVDREKKILEASEKLQTLISHCSSRLCFPLCLCLTTPSGAQYCLEVGCFGPACPKSQINKEFRKIRTYIGEIKGAINGAEPYDTPKTVSLNLLFEEVVPDLLVAVEQSLRIPLSQCGYEKKGDEGVSLLRCDDAKGGTDQTGRLIEVCEAGTNEEWQDTFYGNCLDRCFLKDFTETTGGAYSPFFELSSYRTCVNDCLATICIYKTRHKYNFHCCHVK